MEDRLAAFADLLSARAPALGLIAEGDLHRIRERHIEDSLRAVPLLGGRVVDIGPGAGLPGIPLAIARSDLSFVLVESKRRAVAFLELAVGELGLANVEVRHARIEDVELKADVATARAFAPLARSWDAARRVLVPGGRLLYFAGASWVGSEAAGLTTATIQLAGLESSAPIVIMTREE